MATTKHAQGISKRKCNEFWSLGQWLGRWSLWHLGYADAMQHDTQNMAEREEDLNEDTDSDVTYHREDDSDNSDSCGSDINVDDVETDAMTFRLTSSCVHVCDSLSDDDDDDDDIHFNGVWYTSSNDNDSDCDGDTGSVASCMDDDEATLIETHISTNHEVHQAFDLSTPFQLSTRESRAHRLYDRACNSLSRMVPEPSTSRYAVHTSS